MSNHMHQHVRLLRMPGAACLPSCWLLQSSLATFSGTVGLHTCHACPDLHDEPEILDAGVFDCKPLQFLWAKFGEFYGKENTIMLDDLRRNYVMNKQNGLVIHPFQKAYKNKATDRELVRLKYYLKAIAREDKLSDLNHKHWKSYMSKKCSKEELAQLQQDLDNP
jgi:hypothetical protein